MATKRQPVSFPAARKPLVLDEEGGSPPAPPPETAEGAPPKGPAVAPSRAGKKAVTFYLPRERWLALRTASLRTGRPTHELMAEATEWLLDKYREGEGASGQSGEFVRSCHGGAGRDSRCSSRRACGGS